MGEPVVFTVFFDFLDPWSRVATTRVDRLASELGDGLRVRWKAFMRWPEKAESDLDAFRRAAADWVEPASVEPGLTFSLWSTSSPPPTHSAPPLAALKAVEEHQPDAAVAFRREVFRAYFSENRTVSDPGVLLDVARSVGIGEDDFAVAFRGRYADWVRKVIEDHNDGLGAGITEPPAVIADEKLLVRGPASVEQYRQVHDHVLRQRRRAHTRAAKP